MKTDSLAELIKERRGRLILGNHEISGINQVHVLEPLPSGLDPRRLLTLVLPDIEITLAGVTVGRREFFLCHSIEHSYSFVVETELATQQVSRYRAQYGANDNYDTSTIPQRIVWIYQLNSPRAKEREIARRLDLDAHMYDDDSFLVKSRW